MQDVDMVSSTESTLWVDFSAFFGVFHTLRGMYFPNP